MSFVFYKFIEVFFCLLIEQKNREAYGCYDFSYYLTNMREQDRAKP